MAAKQLQVRLGVEAEEALVGLCLAWGVGRADAVRRALLETAARLRSPSTSSTGGIAHPEQSLPPTILPPIPAGADAPPEEAAAQAVRLLTMSTGEYGD